MATISAYKQERRNADKKDSNRSDATSGGCTDGDGRGGQVASILTKRCNSPEILKSSLAFSNFEDIGKYDLALVKVVTRDGDRTPFADIPLVSIMSFRCLNDYQNFLNKVTWKKC